MILFNCDDRLVTNNKMHIAFLSILTFLVGVASSVQLLAEESNTVPRYAYVANTWDHTISGFTIDEKGMLQPNGGVYTNVKLIPMIIAHPNGKFIYTASRTVDNIPAFQIGRAHV